MWVFYHDVAAAEVKPSDVTAALYMFWFVATSFLTFEHYNKRRQRE